MAYKIIDEEFYACSSGFSEWAMRMLQNKIEEIRELDDPRLQGGAYRGKWAYPVGKFHILAEIDDDSQIIILRRAIRLP